MKNLRLLNVVALLLIFTPFFQMCSDDSAESNLKEVSNSPDVSSDSLGQVTGRSENSPGLIDHVQGDDQTVWEQFWEFITFPGEHFTATAFGLLVLTIFEIVDGNPLDIWIGSVFINLSVFLSIFTFVRILKRKQDKLISWIAINIALILAAFVAAVFTFDSVSQVKWGYYAYLFICLSMFFQVKKLITDAAMDKLQRP